MKCGVTVDLQIYHVQVVLYQQYRQIQYIESFDNLEKNSIDLYASVRSVYLQNRKKKIANSESVVESQDDGDWEEIDN